MKHKVKYKWHLGWISRRNINFYPINSQDLLSRWIQLDAELLCIIPDTVISSSLSLSLFFNIRILKKKQDFDIIPLELIRPEAVIIERCSSSFHWLSWLIRNEVYENKFSFNKIRSRFFLFISVENVEHLTTNNSQKYTWLATSIESKEKKKLHIFMNDQNDIARLVNCNKFIQRFQIIIF